MILSTINNKWFIRLFAALSTLYGFWFIFTMDPYLPAVVRFKKGIWWTGLGHFALWLSVSNIQGFIRYPTAVILLFSLVGLFLLWWNLHLLLAIAFLIYTSWILFTLVRGKQ